MWHVFWKGDVLNQRLRERVEMLVAQAESGDGPHPDSISEVQALRELIGLRSIVLGHTRRVLFWAAVGVTVLGMCLLSRVRSLDVDGMVRAWSVEFVLDHPRIRSLNVDVTALKAAGYTRVVGLPGARSNSLVAPGTLTLEQITLPAGTRVRVANLGRDATLLQVEPSREGGRVRFTSGRGALVRTGVDTLAMEPRSFFELEFDTVSFTLQFVPVVPTLELLSGAPARALSFAETHTSADGRREDVHTPSTVESGELILPTLREQKVTLRPRERLDLRAPALRIHQLRSDTSGVTAGFRARASLLAVGEDDTRRDLKPSRLEWLAASRRLELVWVLFGVGMSVVLAMINWWKRY